MAARVSPIISALITPHNTTENTAYLSAFYRCSKGRDGYWYDECHEWYSYEINFSDDNWIEKLKEAAEKAYEALWEE